MGTWGLHHCKRSGTDAVSDATRAIVSTVAAFAVDLSVGTIVEVGRVQRFVAVETTETPLVPNQVLAEHFFGFIYGASATAAALTILGLWSIHRVELGVERSALHFGGYQGGSVSKTESLRSEQLSVTGTAMDFLVWSIASQHRIQWPVAFVTVEALLVPHGALGKLLFSSEYHSTATWATLTGRSLDAGRIDGNRWLLGGHLLFCHAIGL